MYIIKQLSIVLMIILVCCVSLESEAAIKHSERVYWHLEQSITVKNNKALCALQDENGAHIKSVLADVVETYSYDGIEHADIEFIAQHKVMNNVVRVECR